MNVCVHVWPKRLESAQRPPLEGKLRLSTSSLRELIRWIGDDARGNSGLSMCNGAQATLGPSGARVLMHDIGNDDNGDRDRDTTMTMITTLRHDQKTNDKQVMIMVVVVVIAIQRQYDADANGPSPAWKYQVVGSKAMMPTHPAQPGNSKLSDARRWPSLRLGLRCQLRY